MLLGRGHKAHYSTYTVMKPLVLRGRRGWVLMLAMVMLREHVAAFVALFRNNYRVDVVELLAALSWEYVHVFMWTG